MGDRSKTKQALQVELVALRAELQDTQNMLQQSRARCQSLVETSSGWVWEADVQGVYSDVSGRVRESLGYTPEELVGH